MKILKIIASGYKPLGHGGIVEIIVDIDNDSNLVLYLGNNGDGKSSLLKATLPAPPVSTDFNKNGFLEIHLTHGGSNYITRSEFTSAKGSHSFLKDNEELNISKKATTQQGLCEKCFDLTPTKLSIISGSVEFCRLRPSERKTLTASCYPSDLSFILDNHKKLCSKIREHKTNLKMLTTRQIALTEELLDEPEFVRLTTLIDQINEFRSDLNTATYSVEQEITTLTALPEYTSRIGLDNSVDLVAITKQCKRIRSRALSMRMYKREIYSDDIKSDVAIGTTKINNYNERLQSIVSAGSSLRSEINEHSEIADSNIEVEIDQTRSRINQLEEMCNSIIVDSSLELIPEHDLTSFDLTEIKNICVDLSSCNTLVSSGELNDMTYRLNEQHNNIGRLISIQDDVAGQLKGCLSKINKHKVSEYNQACILPCQLKTNYADVLKDMEQERDLYVQKQVKIQEELESLKKGYRSLKTAVEGGGITHPKIARLEAIFSHYTWAVLALNGKPLILALNENSVKIYNILAKHYDNSAYYYKRQKHEGELTLLRDILKVLVETRLPAKELISKAIIDKRVALDRLLAEHESTKQAITDIELELHNTKQVSDMVDVLDGVNADMIPKLNHNNIALKIRLLKETLVDLNKWRNVIDEKQADIKTTVQKQQSIRIRLTDEIEPGIIELRDVLVRLEHIESALSPTNGLPHVYMVRFLNAIINLTNEYISQVWSYTMELQHISEDKDLTFVIPVKLHNGSMVKDINVCSTGQQEMINLAWMLALCTQMNLGQDYPICLDEIDSGLAPHHRGALVDLLASLVRTGSIKQMFLINHHASAFTAFANSQPICLSVEGIETPVEYNKGVTIIRNGS